jgi:4-amino-4-deoxy-L-arabinose transferase-like glycosyltransferase
LRTLKSHNAFIGIVLFYIVLFVPLIGTVHLFDWDEINFAEAAREMIVTGDWFNVQINYEPFWEKPPLFIWCQALSMKIFGVNEFAARFPNVVVGLVTIFTLYITVLTRYSKQAAVFSVLLYLGSFTSHFYFKSGIIDPLFNLFLFASIIFLVKSKELNRRRNFLFAGIFIGLAVLTKGPTALLLVGLTGLVYQVIYGIRFYTLLDLGLLIGGFLLVTGSYFGVQIVQNGTWFLTEFIVYQIDLFRYPIASHGQPFYYHFVVLLLGCFPLFILAIGSMCSKQMVHGDSTYYRWMKVLFWVVLIVFSLVTTKIVHYSSMCYLPLAVVGGVWLANMKVFTKFQKWMLAIVGSIWFIIMLVFGLFAFNPDVLLKSLSRVIKDDFVLAQLKSETQWSILPLFLSVALIAMIIKAIYDGNKLGVVRLLVVNTLIITLFIASAVPSIERTVQGQWINKLSTYKGQSAAHFTVGFKSYAHLFYTAQQDLPEVNLIKEKLLKEMGLNSLTDLNQFDKNEFDNEVRDFVISETTIPVSVSVKAQKFEEMTARYPELKKVFEGNGYGVWERK